MNPRIKFLKTQLSKKNIQGMIITNPKNVFYLTNIPAEATLLITQKEVVYITDGRYIELAKTTTTIEDELVIYDLREVSKYDYENFFILCQNVGFEENYVTYEKYKKLMHMYKVNNLTETENIIEKIRMIKDDDEIKKIEHACMILDNCFKHLVKYIKKGMTEKEVSYEIKRFLVMEYGVEIAFPPIVASGKNSSMPHAEPTNKKLEGGDPVIIDFGCIYEGYCSDMTRTIFIDYIPENIKRIYDLVLKNHVLTLRELRDGIITKTVSKMVESDFEINGYSLIHSLGHSLGLDIHEMPYINSKTEMYIKENMVLTSEPGIYIPEKFGIRIEDTVLITKVGCVSLTNAERKYIVI